MSSSKPAGRGTSGDWSDGEITALVQAWGQLYLQRNRLSNADWREVCGAVNAHRAAAGRRFERSTAKCQWHLYALKSRYKKEVAKGQPTSGWRHFSQLRAFLAGPDDGPGFAAKMPAASVVKEEEMVEEEEEVEEKKEEASGGASGSVGKRAVPVKRHFSSLEDTLDQSGGPPPGFPPRMPATAKKAKEEVKEEEVRREGPAHGAASADCLPGAVVTKLAQVYWSLEMERLTVEKEKMATERERRAVKVEAENLGETDEATTTE